MITVQGFQQSRRSDAPLPAPRSLSLACFFFPFFPFFNFFLFFFKLSSSSFNPRSREHRWQSIPWGWMGAGCRSGAGWLLGCIQGPQ